MRMKVLYGMRSKFSWNIDFQHLDKANLNLCPESRHLVEVPKFSVRDIRPMHSFRQVREGSGGLVPINAVLVSWVIRGRIGRVEFGGRGLCGIDGGSNGSGWREDLQLLLLRIWDGLMGVDAVPIVLRSDLLSHGGVGPSALLSRIPLTWAFGPGWYVARLWR
jgi:hypothetical protein